MPSSWPIRRDIIALKKEYDSLKKGKEALLTLIDETELPENVYNSNAIENSTLSLAETEKILLEMEVSRKVSVREVFEAKNLARVMNYLKTKLPLQTIDKEIILFLHRMLLTAINDEFAGRFRQKGEYVRVGMHIAPPPEQVEPMTDVLLNEYTENISDFFIDTIAKFHLEFETIHPFCDGNGRIGRVLMNYQMMQRGLPLLIIRDKEKQTYYDALRAYNLNKSTKEMERIIALALMESLHKRIAYLKGGSIISLTDYAKSHQPETEKKSISTLLNAAKRQTIPAFRERGVWKIAIG